MPSQQRNQQLAESLLRIRKDVERMESGIQQVDDMCEQLEASLARSQKRLADLQDGTAVPRPSRKAPEGQSLDAIKIQAEREVTSVIEKLKHTLQTARVRKAQLQSEALQIPKLLHQKKMIEDELAAIEQQELLADGNRLRQELTKVENHIIFLRESISAAETEERQLKLRLQKMQRDHFRQSSFRSSPKSEPTINE